jgi:hypothetical protein
MATSTLYEDHLGDGQGDASQEPSLRRTSFQLPFLSIVFRAKRVNILPRIYVFSFCTLKYSWVHVLRALKMVDTLGFDCGSPPIDQTDAQHNHRVETCLLQLINIIMGYVSYKWLIGEWRTNPWWGEIDQRKTGQDSRLWIDVLKSFKDDSFNPGPKISVVLVVGRSFKFIETIANPDKRSRFHLQCWL